MQSASTLALLQEEELEASRKKGFTLSEHWDSSKHTSKSSYSDKGKLPVRKDDLDKESKSDKEDKLSALVAHRRKLGLCFKCGEKWSHAHKCPQHIPLHVLEEILDAIEPVDDTSDEESELSLDTESPVLAISSKSESRQTSRRTMKLLGTIGKQQVLILVDSDSIGTFVSKSLVQKLQLSTESCPESQFKSASGGVMACNQVVKQLPWLVQGHTFLSDAKVLNLQCYDMIWERIG